MYNGNAARDWDPSFATPTTSSATEKSVRQPAAAVSLRDDDTLSGSKPPAWLSLVEAELVSLGRLEEDWDSYGGRPIDMWMAAGAYMLLGALCSSETPKPTVVPMSSGHVQIEWHTNDVDLEIEFVSASALNVLYENATTGEEFEGLFTYDLTRLKGWVDQLSQG